MSGWTAATCDDCWNRANPWRRATRLVHPVLEKCHACGQATLSGIYIRKNPAEQVYPTHREDD